VQTVRVVRANAGATRAAGYARNSNAKRGQSSLHTLAVMIVNAKTKTQRRIARPYPAWQCPREALSPLEPIFVTRRRNR
jgi:hypothetical protein